MKSLVSGSGLTVWIIAIVLSLALPLCAQTVGPLNYVYMPETYAGNGQEFAFPVYLQNGVELDFVCAPLVFNPGTWVTIDSVSFVGSRLISVPGTLTSGFDDPSHTFFIKFDADPGNPIPIGNGLLAAVHIRISQNATAHDIEVDSTFIGPDLSYALLNVGQQNVASFLISGLIHVITERPVVHLEPDEFFFTAVEGINPLAQEMSITNLGEDPLHWEISDYPAWLTLSATSGTAPSVVELQPDVTGLGIGSYFDSLAVFNSLADVKKTWAYIHLEITEEPTEETICLELKLGWNLISWNLDTPDDDVETIIADIKGCIYGIYGFEAGAATYDPNLPQFSTLHTLDHLHGYWFRMECDTVLCITGVKAPAGTPIDLEENWNLVSYLPDEEYDPASALVTVHSNLVVALGYDDGGLTYDPANPDLSTLTLMKPGFGYWLKTTASGSLVYPHTVYASGILPSQANWERKYSYSPLTPTREWIDLYGEGLRLDGKLITAGSVVEVFNEAGVLCGYAVVELDGRLNFTPVYFDDPTTPANEGVSRGGSISMTINGQPVRQSFQAESFGQRIRLGEMNSLPRISQQLPTSFALEQNFPNPFNPVTMIEFGLPQNTHVRLEVYNVLGERITTLVDRFLPTGQYNIAWDGRDHTGKSVASGLYFYRLTTTDFTETRKMMLVK